MEYSKIISVAGLPGLYELVNTKPDGAIVRSLDDKSTRFASSRIHNFSHLESIEVYTVRENVNLADVFQTMEKAGGSLPDTKDNAAIKKYFEKVYPDIDFERVYNSDLKKMIKWYEVLKSNNIEIKLTEPEPETAVEEETEAVKESKQPSPKETKKSEAPKQKQGKKSSGSVSEKTAKKEDAEEKSSRSKSEKPVKKTAKKTKK
jgi:hypothetical protein